MDYYLAVSANARKALNFPIHPEFYPPAERMPAGMPSVANLSEASDWIIAEEPAMRNLARQAKDEGVYEPVWHLMCNLVMLYYRAGLLELGDRDDLRTGCGTGRR